MQAVGLRVLQDNKPLNNALNTIRAVQALTAPKKGQEPDTTTCTFAAHDDSAFKRAEAMARIASRKQRQIAEQLNAVKGAVKNP